MDIEDWDIDIIQQLGVELDRVAGGEEYHHLLVSVLLEEGEEEEEPLLRGTYHVTL